MVKTVLPTAGEQVQSWVSKLGFHIPCGYAKLKLKKKKKTSRVF